MLKLRVQFMDDVERLVTHTGVNLAIEWLLPCLHNYKFCPFENIDNT